MYRYIDKVDMHVYWHFYLHLHIQYVCTLASCVRFHKSTCIRLHILRHAYMHVPLAVMCLLVVFFCNGMHLNNRLYTCFFVRMGVHIHICLHIRVCTHLLTCVIRPTCKYICSICACPRLYFTQIDVLHDFSKYCSL